MFRIVHVNPRPGTHRICIHFWSFWYVPQLSHRLFWRCHHHRCRDCIGGGHCGGSHCGHHWPGWPNHGVCHRRLSQISGAWHHWRCKRCGYWDSHWCHRCTVQEMACATGQTVHHIAWSANDRRGPLEALPRDPIGRNGGCNAGHVHDFGHKVSRIGTPWHNAHDAGFRHLRTSRSPKQLQDVNSTDVIQVAAALDELPYLPTANSERPQKAFHEFHAPHVLPNYLVSAAKWHPTVPQ